MPTPPTPAPRSSMTFEEPSDAHRWLLRHPGAAAVAAMLAGSAESRACVVEAMAADAFDREAPAHKVALLQHLLAAPATRAVVSPLLTRAARSLMRGDWPTALSRTAMAPVLIATVAQCDDPDQEALVSEMISVLLRHAGLLEVLGRPMLAAIRSVSLRVTMGHFLTDWIPVSRQDPHPMPDEDAIRRVVAVVVAARCADPTRRADGVPWAARRVLRQWRQYAPAAAALREALWQNPATRVFRCAEEPDSPFRYPHDPLRDPADRTILWDLFPEVLAEIVHGAPGRAVSAPEMLAWLLHQRTWQTPAVWGQRVADVTASMPAFLASPWWTTCWAAACEWHTQQPGLFVTADDWTPWLTSPHAAVREAAGLAVGAGHASGRTLARPRGY